MARIPIPPPNAAVDAAAASVLVEAFLAFSRYWSCRLASLPAIRLMSSRGTPMCSRSMHACPASFSDGNTPATVFMKLSPVESQHDGYHPDLACEVQR